MCICRQLIGIETTLVLLDSRLITQQPLTDFLSGVNNNKSSLTSLQYFMLCRQSKVALMYEYYMAGEICTLIGILRYE